MIIEIVNNKQKVRKKKTTFSIDWLYVDQKKNYIL